MRSSDNFENFTNYIIIPFMMFLIGFITGSSTGVKTGKNIAYEQFIAGNVAQYNPKTGKVEPIKGVSCHGTGDEER